MKTSLNLSVGPANSQPISLAVERQRRAFTLVELLVVVGTLAVLALVLAPALAGTRTDTARFQCQNNLKQLQLGFSQFTQDHNDMFPPGGYQANSGVLTWDSWIYNYISGGRSVTVNQAMQGVYAMNTNVAAAYGVAVGLPIMACPVDAQLPKINWMHANGDPAQPLQFAPRTYTMNSAGSTYGSDIMINPQNGLPDLNQAGRHGVGIFWTANTSYPDWDAKGYKTSVVKDPGGTILLCETASSMQAEGNIWPCVCLGPQTADGTSAGWGNLYQIDTIAPQDMSTLTAGGYNEGRQLYQAHGNRFNYLFHDGHVAVLKIEDTIGTASGALKWKNIAGMWTVKPGD
jgi:prepilin-type processing-associated H-X9-DG protein